MTGTIKLAGFIASLIFLTGIGTCVYVCGSAAKATKDSGGTYVAPPPASNEAPKPSGTGRQQEIASSLNGLFKQAKVAATVVIADDALVIAPDKRDDCDLKVLREFRKMLAAFDLNPASAFASMRCTGGAELNLR